MQLELLLIPISIINGLSIYYLVKFILFLLED